MPHFSKVWLLCIFFLFPIPSPKTRTWGRREWFGTSQVGFLPNFFIEQFMNLGKCLISQGCHNAVKWACLLYEVVRRRWKKLMYEKEMALLTENMKRNNEDCRWNSNTDPQGSAEATPKARLLLGFEAVWDLWDNLVDSYLNLPYLSSTHLSSTKPGIGRGLGVSQQWLGTNWGVPGYTILKYVSLAFGLFWA